MSPHRVTADHGDLFDFAESLRKIIPTLEKKRDALVALFEKWVRLDQNGDNAAPDTKKLKAAITSFNTVFEKAILSVPVPQSVRPKERERIESALATLREMTGKNLRYNLDKVYKGISSGNLLPDVLTQMLKKAVEGFIEHDLRYSIENLIESDQQLVPRRFQLGRFTIIDDYGLSESAASHWFEAIRHAAKILESKGFGYLLYGRLNLTAAEKWGGLYYTTDDHIDLHLNQTTGGNEGHLVGLLIHELGHRLWFKFLDQGRRDLFSSPWIDQAETFRDVYEKVNQVLTVPVQEREEAFRLVQKTEYDFAAFVKWMRGSPERFLRWQRRMSDIRVDLGADDAQLGHRRQVLREGFDKAKKWFQERREYIAEYDKAILTEQDPEYRASQIEQNEVRKQRTAKAWQSHHVAWTKEYSNSGFTMQDIEEAFEPGSADTRNPLAVEIQEVLKVSPIKPSVTEYGQTNRKEDFAETFEEVITGKEKRHEYVVRLQRAVPKGIVASIGYFPVGDAMTQKKKVQARWSAAMQRVIQELGEIFKKANLKVRPADRPDAQSFHWDVGKRDYAVEVQDDRIVVDMVRVQKWPMNRWPDALEHLAKELGVVFQRPAKPGLMKRLLPQFAELDSYFSIDPMIPTQPVLDPGPCRSVAMNRLHPSIRKQIIKAMLDAKRPDLANVLSREAARPVRAAVSPQMQKILRSPEVQQVNKSVMQKFAALKLGENDKKFVQEWVANTFHELDGMLKRGVPDKTHLSALPVNSQPRDRHMEGDTGARLSTQVGYQIGLLVNAVVENWGSTEASVQAARPVRAAEKSPKKAFAGAHKGVAETMNSINKVLGWFNNAEDGLDSEQTKHMNMKGMTAAMSKANDIWSKCRELERLTKALSVEADILGLP